MYLSAGTLLQRGKYKIARYISHGGFGCTYEALNTTWNNRRVAIKELFISEFCDRDATTGTVSLLTESKRQLFDKLRGKFLDEADKLNGLTHPGIVRVTDAFEENGTAYYVMDYIEGDSLKEVVKKRGALNEEEAVGYIRQAADALQYVHACKLLHLDIKPANVMLRPDGVTVLIDFGVSKQYDEENGENTSTLMGHSPGYAPPEQMNNRVGKFLPSTDIYALGATLYTLLSGVIPPSANDIAAGEELTPLPANISAATRRAVESAMIINKFKRPQSIADFLSLLDGKEAAADDEKTNLGGDLGGGGGNNRGGSTAGEKTNLGVGGNGNNGGTQPGGGGNNGGTTPKPQPVPTPTPKPQPTPKRKLKWVWAAVAAVVLGIVGYFVEGGQGGVVTEEATPEVTSWEVECCEDVPSEECIGEYTEAPSWEVECCEDVPSEECIGESVISWEVECCEEPASDVALADDNELTKFLEDQNEAVSIWYEAAMAQLENQEDEPESLNYQDVMQQLENEQLDARLNRLRAEKMTYDQLVGDSAIDMVPTFGLR